ncbi:abhydrolase domain containing Hydr1 isoform X2 [Nomia melanderi]|uniref:abhydrolase domain containing Hydr1 isoform X2 n=1 Tax=Nomia melanderi TaxID=2448451 RepID=UPI0013041232|nr:phospholipase ABHD3 isoform X2 [Nomia melanderi]
MKPMLVCANGPFRSFLEDHVPLVSNKFWPTLWCFESRAQTIIASLLRARILPPIVYRREILTLSDGGEVALDWAEEGSSVTSPIVIILPGLTGESQAEYIKCLVTSAKKVGIRCVIFNNRGLGGVELKTPRTYCAANSDDLSEVIEHVRKLYPHVPLGATGISMGGLILGNYLAQQGVMARNKLRGCFLISVPWNVFAAAKNTEENYFNRMMNKYLASTLRKNVQRLHYATESGFFDVDIETLLKSQTVREFDSHFTVKQFGYRDVEEYYSNATIHDKLHLIDVPLLCLSAADDPFQPVQAIPLKEISETKKVAVVVTSRGGHIGFLEGMWPVKEEQYIGKLFSQFFTALFTTDVDHQLL